MVELWLEGSWLPTVWPIRLNEAILHAWRQLLGGRLRRVEHRDVYEPRLLFILSVTAAESVILGNDALSCSICNSSPSGHDTRRMERRSKGTKER